jgi:WD40 repeat protein
VRVWDLATRMCVWRAFAHSGFVRGLVVAPDASTFFSCGDKTVKQWDLRTADDTAEVGEWPCGRLPFRGHMLLVG